MGTTVIRQPAKLLDKTFDVIEVLGDPRRPIAVSFERCRWRALYALGAMVSIWGCGNIAGTGVGCSEYPSWAQLDKCRHSSIRFCEVVNGWDRTPISIMPEDQISLYQSRDCVVAHCWVEGLPGPCPSDHSGSGINIDDGCQRCRVERCYAVNTGNAGICITGGQNNRLIECYAASNQLGANGDVGFQLHNYYPQSPWGGNVAIRCFAAWRTRSRGRGEGGWNNYLDPNAPHWHRCGGIRTANADVGAIVRAWREAWARVRAACGADRL